ncbi:Alpha/Beta hydrolase protein [Lophiotrema nucula]|uniref:Alpha/Beta hydrolase protein n=1 Tax=Lophiotrema nucula TaxID=690887 RepID=A0A6A5YNL2_9PLEO|nr:Alpha/Beta hydrolase protein [Lophiotrema nucula]
MGYTYKDSDSNNTTKHTSAPVAAIVTPSVVVSLAIVILVCYLCWRHKRKCKYTGVAGDAESSSNAESSSKTAFGIKLLHDVEDAVVDIIFIHGLGGHRERTWRANGASNPWPQTLLPSKVPNARILTFGYGADVADWVRMVSANSLGNHAMNLLTAIATYREEDKTNNRPIIFVCHSLGGLLCEDALSRQRPDKHIKRISECTRAVAFLGTPHHGSDLAKWAETLAKTIGVFKRVNTKLLAVLKRDSEVLARVQDSFHTMIMSRRQDGLPPIAITCFFEQVPLSNVGLVVPSHSAILPGYMPIGIHKNHSDMTKFRGLDDDDFKAVAGEIRRWVKELEEEGDFGPL